jgi:hypothetical protein
MFCNRSLTQYTNAYACSACMYTYEWLSLSRISGNHIPEELVVVQLVEKLHAFDGTLIFIMSFTHSRTEAYLESVKHITLPHTTTIPLRSSLMLSSYLRTGLTSDHVNSVSSAKILYDFRFSHAGYMPCPFSLPAFDQLTNSFWGVRGSVVGWGTMLQAGRSPVRVPDEVHFLNIPNPSSRTMTLGSTQPLREMSNRNLPAGKKQPARRDDNLAAICEPNVWKCGSLNLSQPYGPACTGITLPLPFTNSFWRLITKYFYAPLT